jgi:hypothetical protein
MILLPYNSVQRDRFFEIVAGHGVTVEFVSRGRVRLRHDEKKFVEIWRLTDADDFIYPDHVERIAERLGIDLAEFFPDRPDMSP